LNSGNQKVILLGEALVKQMLALDISAVGSHSMDFRRKMPSESLACLANHSSSFQTALFTQMEAIGRDFLAIFA